MLSVFCALFGSPPPSSVHSRSRNSFHVTRQLHVQIRPEYQVFPRSAGVSPLCALQFRHIIVTMNTRKV